MVRNQTYQNVFLRIRGIVKKVLGVSFLPHVVLISLIKLISCSISLTSIVRNRSVLAPQYRVQVDLLLSMVLETVKLLSRITSSHNHIVVRIVGRIRYGVSP